MCPLLVTSTLVCGGRNQTGAAPLGGAARRSRVTHPLTVRHSGDMPDQGDEEWLWDIDPTVDYITQGGHSAAALQFPDDLLRHSTRVAALLAAKLGSRCRVYVLAVRPPPGAAVDCQLLCHSLHAKSNHHHAPWPGLRQPQAYTTHSRVLHSLPCRCSEHQHVPISFYLQDTAYNPLAVDEVAAQHVSAGCVVSGTGVSGCYHQPLRGKRGSSTHQFAA